MSEQFEPNEGSVNEPVEAEKFHHWLATIEVTIRKDDKIRKAVDNMFITSAAPHVNLATLNHTRFMFLNQFTQATGTKSEDIKGFVFLNLSHLGYMTDAQFQEVPVISE